MTKSVDNFRPKNLVLSAITAVLISIPSFGKDSLAKNSQEFSDKIENTLSPSDDREKVLKKISKITTKYNSILEAEFTSLSIENRDSLRALDSALIDAQNIIFDKKADLDLIEKRKQHLPNEIQKVVSMPEAFPENYQDSLIKELEGIEDKIKGAEKEYSVALAEYDNVLNNLNKSWSALLPKSATAYGEAYNNIIKVSEDYNASLSSTGSSDYYINPDLRLLPEPVLDAESE